MRIRKPAQKSVRRAARHEQERLVAALDEMKEEPLAGDVARLGSQPTAFRRRVGGWRIFFDVYPEERVVNVTDIRRRTTTTYRRR